jgi:hypothetical protein
MWRISNALSWEGINVDFKTFFVKKVLMSFFVSTTCICAAMALIGIAFLPDARFGYQAFLSPLLFGALASLPTLATFTKKELSLKQMVWRNVFEFFLLEFVILSALYFAGLLTSVSVSVSLAVSIFIIYLTVNLVLWINDKKTAKIFNDALKKFQNANTSRE